MQLCVPCPWALQSVSAHGLHAARATWLAPLPVPAPPGQELAELQRRAAALQAQKVEKDRQLEELRRRSKALADQIQAEFGR